MHYYLRRGAAVAPGRGRRCLDDHYAELQPRLIRALAATVGSYSGVEDAVQEGFTEMPAHDQEAIANVGGWVYTAQI